MRRALRNALVLLGAATLAFTSAVSSTAIGTAALPTPLPNPAIAQLQPAAGQNVGVGHPLIVRFAGPVADRAAIERSIRIVSPASMTGRTQWMSADTLQWIPDHYWPAHSDIKASIGNIPLDFETGAEVLGVASISAHTFTVSIDGVVQRQMPASMGKPRHPTPVGSFTALGKESVVVMDSRTIGIPLSDPEGYKLTVNNAVRVTWGGVYVHSAPWSVSSQGYANVSHGCINLGPDNAAWYFNTVHVGDPIVINA